MNLKHKYILICFITSTAVFCQETAFNNLQNRIPSAYSANNNFSSANSNMEPVSTKSYYALCLYGCNQILGNEVSEHDIATFIINPVSSENRPGFSFSYIKEHHGSNEGVLFFQGSFKLGIKYLYLKSGLNVLAEIKPEDGPGGLIFPHAEIGIGQLDRIYLSANVLSDILFGMGSINFNYIFNDNISSLMIGRAFSDNGHYRGLTYKVDCKLWKCIVARAWGNASFAQRLYGLQIGLGITI
jgi:hypothetical protein